MISRLKLKTTEYKGVVERSIRACFMLEHDYLMLTEKVIQCILQDLEENDSKMTCALPVSHLLYNMKKEEFGMKINLETCSPCQKFSLFCKLKLAFELFSTFGQRPLNYGGKKGY